MLQLRPFPCWTFVEYQIPCYLVLVLTSYSNIIFAICSKGIKTWNLFETEGNTETSPTRELTGKKSVELHNTQLLSSRLFSTSLKGFVSNKVKTARDKSKYRGGRGNENSIGSRRTSNQLSSVAASTSEKVIPLLTLKRVKTLTIASSVKAKQNDWFMTPHVWLRVQVKFMEEETDTARWRS